MGRLLESSRSPLELSCGRGAAYHGLASAAHSAAPKAALHRFLASRTPATRPLLLCAFFNVVGRFARFLLLKLLRRQVLVLDREKETFFLLLIG
jgi:hypothetical protein